jgi:signal transduction histidine kinase
MEAMGEVPEVERRLTISVCCADEGVEVAVEDRGHGIPPGLLPRLFDSFVTGRDDGIGLGLSISRSIVEAHGGRIRAENNPAGGATVRFTLPVEAAGPSLDSPDVSR